MFYVFYMLSLHLRLFLKMVYCLKNKHNENHYCFPLPTLSSENDMAF